MKRERESKKILNFFYIYISVFFEERKNINNTNEAVSAFQKEKSPTKTLLKTIYKVYPFFGCAFI